MTQVARGVGPGGGNRPGVGLPIRIHDLLLTLAGRVDDDALADARQMLASAELDRSLEFLAGCLAAGRVVLTREQHAELEALFADTYLDSSVIDRVLVTDRLNIGRHRFAVGAVDGREPDRGVADAVRPVLDVLPDVRSMWCVWRLTPAGPASGPVPHLLVLVGIGPGGFPPATAYRVEHALRRAGIRASVEVLMDGVEPDEYHREAMRNARQVPFDGHGSNRTRVEPAFEAPRVAPARARVEPPRLEPPRGSAVPPEAPRIESVRPSVVPPEPPRMESTRAERSEPRIEPVSPPRIEPVPSSRIEPVSSAHSEPVSSSRIEPVSSSRLEPVRDPAPVDAPRIDEPHVELPVRKDPPFAVEQPVQAFSEPESRIDPPTKMTPAAGGLTSDDEPPPRIEAVRADPFEQPRQPEFEQAPEPQRQPEFEARQPEPPFEQPRQEAFEQPREQARQPEAQFEQERLPEDEPTELPQSALREETRTDSAPSPRPRAKAKEDEPPARQKPEPANGGVDKHSQAFVDDILNTQERNLLRELQDELARREQQESQPNAGSSWRIDRSGRHGKPASAGFDHPNQTTGPMIINGVPPHPDKRGYPPAN